MPFAGCSAIDLMNQCAVHMDHWLSKLLRSPRRMVKDSLSSSLTRLQGGGPLQKNMQRPKLYPKVVCELLQRLGRFC